jgi:hypothetical protein
MCWVYSVLVVYYVVFCYLRNKLWTKYAFVIKEKYWTPYIYKLQRLQYEAVYDTGQVAWI